MVLQVSRPFHLSSRRIHARDRRTLLSAKNVKLPLIEEWRRHIAGNFTFRTFPGQHGIRLCSFGARFKSIDRRTFWSADQDDVIADDGGRDQTPMSDVLRVPRSPAPKLSHVLRA